MRVGRSTWRRGEVDDRGLVTSALVVVVCVGVVALLFLAVLPLLVGTDQKSRTQTAADAAALAGAEAVREHALAHLGDVIRPVGGVSFADLLGPSRGLGQAQVYAARNDATVGEYRYDPFADEVRVVTRSTQAPPRSGGEPASIDRTQAGATAEVGVDLAECVFSVSQKLVGHEPVPTPEPPPPGAPEPTPSPTPTPTPTPVPIYDDEYRFSCPGLRAVPASLDLAAVLGDARAALDDALKPKLVR
ncbi:hypothetical protein AB6N24_15390 [Cellulomonas sp. 179-A 4D5 NHS]|uniref:hypothetical protein n=1 Tax=Cellulomonas sp. 179-A 4D5 NHS TaxID=3142378 RepID=UPI00399F10D3